MESQRTRMVVCGIVGFFLSALGGLCLHGCMGDNKVILPVFGVPIFLWGMGGYALLAISYGSCPFLDEKIAIIIPVFSIMTIAYGTSAAISISIGTSLFCPFCIAAWLLNLFISISIMHELVFIRQRI